MSTESIVSPRPSNGSARPASVVRPQRPRYSSGWRHNKPVEDPDKTKRWGFVTANPSEYLIHVRRGKIRRRTSGQGSTCFKWPWDSVAIIPTTINRLMFRADQVTREKVGVEVHGLAVFRIVDPLLAYRMLNFSFTERASEKLEEILGEMFVGATRRLVANLTVEEAITQRKDALAAELMREIAPVVQGNGRSDDGTDRGWGVVIDTIEVQDVRILSERVFTNMQAEFRASLEQRSREAELEAEKAIALRESANQRTIAEAKITSDVETRELRAHGESQAAKVEVTEQGEVFEATYALKRRQQDAEIEYQERQSSAQADLKRRQAELTRLVGLINNEVYADRKRIDNTFSEDRIQMELVTKALPAIASAFAQSYGEVHLTQIGNGEGSDPSTMIAGAIAQVMEVARAAGLSVTRKKETDE